MNSLSGNRRGKSGLPPVFVLGAAGAAISLFLLLALFPDAPAAFRARNRAAAYETHAGGAYELFERDLFYFDTYIEMTVYAKGGRDGEAALDGAEAVLRRVHNLTDRFGGGGDICRVNRAEPGDMPVAVDAETFSLLKTALKYCGESGGAFDIGIGAVSDLWGFGAAVAMPGQTPAGPAYAEAGNLRAPPGPESVAAVLEAGGDEKIILHEDVCAVEIPPGLLIDLGSIAKGYAVGEAARFLREAGIENAVINAGGNIQTIGMKPAGSENAARFWNIFSADTLRPWIIGVRNPRPGTGAGGELAAVLSVSDKAVVTSGDYERYFEYDGVRYHHIFDPRTGEPARACVSATVVADDSALADYLSTAVFVLGPVDGLKLVGKYRGAEAMAVAPDMSVYKTPGFDDMLQ